MYYIKCGHCGGLIEVKSEYMAFCPQCRAKLDNSFAAWRSRSANEGRPFAEYLQEVAVSETAMAGAGEQRRIGRSIRHRDAGRRVLWALAGIVPLVLVAAGVWWYVGQRAGRNGSIEALLGDRAWKIGYYPDLGATLKFPHTLELAGGFTADSLQADSMLVAQQQVVLSLVSRQWTDPGVITVTASRIDYRPDFGVDREVATGQILQGIITGEGAAQRPRAFEFFKNDYSVPNIEARSLGGQYLLGIRAFEFRALMAQYGHTVWYFMVAYPRDTPEGILVAERFFHGILLDRKLE